MTISSPIFCFFELSSDLYFPASTFGVLGFISSCVYIIMEKINDRHKTVKLNFTAINESSDEPTTVTEKVNLRVIASFPVVFWIICGIIAIFYAIVFPFESTATSLLSTRYGYNTVEAGRIISFLPFVSMILSPIIGLTVDKIGWRTQLVLGGLVVMTTAFALMAFTPINPIPCVVVFGIVFSLVPAALWPCVPIVISTQLATAFGLMTSIINFAMLVTYYAQGLVADDGHTTNSLIFYTSLGFFGIALGSLWYILDYRAGSPSSKRSSILSTL